ncbi:rhodanese-like domain-containing protein [Spiroplasma diminutum]|uniref:Rhodanese domain-containing protein n=1 Tax=Spiroplasma diminutum CUAS-1 TaxID=1276221 RepID=S5MDW7_9MOLU|nr:rhodanese-like domain-containing protein [Spiroplasma diminutum]AGR41913.1 hypothetical protein SDIMI_v3c02090 [Spiroplasma diminutum CUAS-1]
MYITKEEYSKDPSKYFTLDVRTAIEFKVLPHFDWAINIEMDKFLKNYKSFLDEHNIENKPIVVVCNAGNRSGQTALFLIEKGYDAKTLQGGVYHYTKQKIS